MLLGSLNSRKPGTNLEKVEVKPWLSILQSPIDPLFALIVPLKSPSVAFKTPSAVTLNFPLSVSIIF